MLETTFPIGLSAPDYLSQLERGDDDVPLESMTERAGVTLETLRRRSGDRHELLARWAESDLPMLLTGPADTNAIRARMIHEKSPRANQPFGKVRCSGWTCELLEIELFGLEFETASSLREGFPGILERCSGGTVFLGDISSLPWRLQARLVDVLDQKRWSRLEGKTWVEADVRIITSLPLAAALSVL